MDRDESYEAWSEQVDCGYMQQLEAELAFAPCPGGTPGYADCCRADNVAVDQAAPF